MNVGCNHANHVVHGDNAVIYMPVLILKHFKNSKLPIRTSQKSCESPDKSCPPFTRIAENRKPYQDNSKNCSVQKIKICKNNYRELLRGKN